MEKSEKKMQNENFDVEVQYCDPDNCTQDCLTGMIVFFAALNEVAPTRAYLEVQNILLNI